MMSWSGKHTLALGLGLILATNAVALLGVAYNRAGEQPESQLELSDRELKLPYWYGHNDDNSGISLSLQWRFAQQERGNGYYRNGPAWLDKTKLAELGFDVSRSIETSEDRAHYDRMLGRKVFLVLEFDGPVFRQALQRAQREWRDLTARLAASPNNEDIKMKVNAAKETLVREEYKNTRLYVIDAGVDATALRTKYSERARYAILSGQISPDAAGPDNRPYLTGRIHPLNIESINVPFVYRYVFEPLVEARRNDSDQVYSGPIGKMVHRIAPEKLPEYAVTVAFGNRLEPWIKAASTPRAKGSE